MIGSIDLGGDSSPSALSFASPARRDLRGRGSGEHDVISPANDLGERPTPSSVRWSQGSICGLRRRALPGSGRVREPSDPWTRSCPRGAHRDRQASGTRARTCAVLITGANGYLGRFPCLDWLERMAARGPRDRGLPGARRRRGRGPRQARRGLRQRGIPRCPGDSVNSPRSTSTSSRATSASPGSAWPTRCGTVSLRTWTSSCTRVHL